MTEEIRVPEGLYGVAVTDTKIAKSDADGSLVYRGYDIHDLAKNASFEETACLILRGSLPKRSELSAFRSSLAERMAVDPGTYDLIRTLPKGSHPMDVLRTAVSSLDRKSVV
jgi:citrate synthase